MNPSEESDIKRLNDSIRWSLKKLSPFREERLAGLRQMVGFHYGENGSQEKVPVNMIELAVNIYSRQIVARNPRATCVSIDRTMNVEASDLETALNYRIETMGLEATLRESLMEAMFGMGIVKVGVNPEDIGEVYAMPVYFDDWVQDMRARRPSEWAYCGNRYRVPLEDAIENETFDPKLRRELKPSYSHPSATEGNDNRSQVLTAGDEMIFDEYLDYVELWDIWLPREKVLLTLSADNESMPPLRIAEWDGPKRGPFHTLGLGDVSGNALPLPPVASWVDLHTLINILFNKLGKQAERQKSQTLVSKSAMDDAVAVRDEGDGAMVPVNDPSNFVQVSYGGIDQSNFAFMLQSQQMLKQLAGNLDSLGGLGTNAETYGQDKLIAESSSQRIGDMRDRVIKFAKEIITDIGEYEWKDPITERRLVKKIPGSDIEDQVDWSPATRNGDYYRFNIDIEPYSMQAQTPATKLNQLNQIVTTLVIPSLPMMQQQGKGLNFDELFSIYAKYGDLPELLRILTNITPPQDAERMQLRGSPVTRRENVRRNIPGASQQGQEAAMIQMLMGGQPQEAEMAAMAR